MKKLIRHFLWSAKVCIKISSLQSCKFIFLMQNMLKLKLKSFIILGIFLRRKLKLQETLAKTKI